MSAFHAPPFTFTLDDGFTVVELGEGACELALDDLDLRLEAAAALPARGGAPLASWLLARLERMTGGLGRDPAAVDEIEGAVFVLDFVVREGDAEVAKVQVQAGGVGAGLLGVVRSAADAPRVVDAWIAALVAAPAQVASVRIQVAEPAGRGPPAAYGHDGARYLG